MWATVRAVHGSARAGRCKFCHHRIVWVTLQTGKMLPFDLGFTVREVVTDPRTGMHVAVLDRSDRHDCQPWKKKNPGQNANTGSHERQLR